MRKAWPTELGEPFGVSCHQFEVRAEPGREPCATLRPNHWRRHATVNPSPCVRLAIRDAEFSRWSMRNRSRRASSRPRRPDIEMGSSAVCLDIESVDAHCRALRPRTKRGAVDAARIAFREEKAPVFVVADDAHCFDRQSGSRRLRSSAMFEPGPAVLAINREHFVRGVLIRPASDRLVEIDAPCAGRQHATPFAHR